MTARSLNVTVWNEFRHEKKDPAVARVYPDGIHNAIKSALIKSSGFEVRTATLDEPEHGLSADVLDNTDVLFWWGHIAHNEVDDRVVDRIQQRVLTGMGLIVLHSGHRSRIFCRMMGTNCTLKWREDSKHERIWTVAPTHDIAQGIGDSIDLPQTEMYGEKFDIPVPDELVFISWYPGGEVFRSGCCFTRGHGRIFYFSPGHETFPIYHDPQICRVLTNAASWAAPRFVRPTIRGEDVRISPEARLQGKERS